MGLAKKCNFDQSQRTKCAVTLIQSVPKMKQTKMSIFDLFKKARANTTKGRAKPHTVLDYTKIAAEVLAEATGLSVDKALSQWRLDPDNEFYNSYLPLKGVNVHGAIRIAGRGDSSDSPVCAITIQMPDGDDVSKARILFYRLVARVTMDCDGGEDYIANYEALCKCVEPLIYLAENMKAHQKGIFEERDVNVFYRTNGILVRISTTPIANR